jgi:hypothetical protein
MEFNHSSLEGKAPGGGVGGGRGGSGQFSRGGLQELVIKGWIKAGEDQSDPDLHYHWIE